MSASMMDLLRRLYPLRMAPVSAGLDQATEILRGELPFVVHEYASRSEHNGWVVPDKWEVVKAEIRRDGELVYDGAAHPLGVIGSSRSFQGTLPLAELRAHLFHHPVLPDARVYHCDMYYKPWREDWGFSMGRETIEALPDGDYEVDLVTTHEPGTMKVADYLLPGELTDTIVLNAHDCHAGQANDDIAGVVIGVEVMRRLAARERRRYTYRLIVAPEHIGTVFFLAGLGDDELATLRFGIFLEMLGNDNRLGLQRTFTGDTVLDRAAEIVLAHREPDAEVRPFRKLVGNDETVWEAPGIEVPTISLARHPYVEYHSDQDTDAIVSERRLEESAERVLDILDVLETDAVMHRRFTGLIALSNPRYDLYIDNSDPSIRATVPERQTAWNYLMDCLPRSFDGRDTVLDVAERHGLPYHEVREYVGRFEAKGLVQLAPPPSQSAGRNSGPSSSSIAQTKSR